MSKSRHKHSWGTKLYRGTLYKTFKEGERFVEKHPDVARAAALATAAIPGLNAVTAPLVVLTSQGAVAGIQHNAAEKKRHAAENEIKQASAQGQSQINSDFQREVGQLNQEQANLNAQASQQVEQISEHKAQIQSEQKVVDQQDLINQAYNHCVAANAQELNSIFDRLTPASFSNLFERVSGIPNVNPSILNEFELRIRPNELNPSNRLRI